MENQNIDAVTFDYLQNEYFNFNEKLKFFSELKEGDKIYNYNDEIFIDKNSYYQGLMRLIRGENKYQTMNYLYNMQHNYFKFLKEIIEFLENNTINYDIEEFIVCIKDLNKVILDGLEVLTNTYIEFEDIINYREEMFKKFNLFNFTLKTFINNKQSFNDN